MKPWLEPRPTETANRRAQPIPESGLITYARGNRKILAWILTVGTPIAALLQTYGNEPSPYYYPPAVYFLMALAGLIFGAMLATIVCTILALLTSINDHLANLLQGDDADPPDEAHYRPNDHPNPNPAQTPPRHAESGPLPPQ